MSIKGYLAVPLFAAYANAVSFGRGVAAALAVVSSVLTPAPSSAQAYPVKPIRIVSPFSAGSAPDQIGRLVAQSLGERLGQNVVVENRPGAGTLLATKAV